MWKCNAALGFTGCQTWSFKRDRVSVIMEEGLAVSQVGWIKWEDEKEEQSFWNL